MGWGTNATFNQYKCRYCGNLCTDDTDTGDSSHERACAKRPWWRRIFKQNRNEGQGTKSMSTLPWFYDREQSCLYSATSDEPEIVCQVLDAQLGETIACAVNNLAHFYTDKASAWDAVARKNAEISDLRQALEQIRYLANQSGLSRSLIDRINTVAVEALLA